MTKTSHPPSLNNETKPEQPSEPAAQSTSVPPIAVASTLCSPNLPKSAQSISIILNSFGIADVQPNVIYQLQEFAHRYTCDVLQDAQILSDHCGKTAVDYDDVSEAIYGRIHHSFAPPPPQDFLDELAQTVNSIPLPPIQEKFGVRLPPEKYCLTSANYQIIPDSSALGASRHTLTSKPLKVPQSEVADENEIKEQRQNAQPNLTLGSNGLDFNNIKGAPIKRSDSGPKFDKSTEVDEDEDLEFEEVDDSIKPSE